jgi:hypothetical protein
MALPFPTPEELWGRTFADQNELRERFAAVDFKTSGGKRELRYYQHKVVNAAFEALAKGDRRILLTLGASGVCSPGSGQLSDRMSSPRSGRQSRHSAIAGDGWHKQS